MGNDFPAVFGNRARILDQGVWGLFLANGGAAISVLALVGNVIEHDPGMAKGILGNLYLFAAGLACASLVYFVRFARALATDSATAHRGADGFTIAWALLALGSIGCFVAGVILVGRAATG